MRPRSVGRRLRSATRALTRSRKPATKAARPRKPTESGAGRWLPGTLRGHPYHVYVPPRLGRGRVPLLVLLHGCQQTSTEFAAATRFNVLADRHRFVVAYPEQTVWNHRQRCWRWYDPAHQQRGTGEPAAIAAITAAVVAEPTRWRIDPARVYVAGLSAGGALALILAATYPDLYAAVGIHSAPAYRSASGGQEALSAMAGRTVLPAPHVHPAGGTGMPPAIVFHGSTDSTVRPRNGQRIAEQWLAHREAYATAAHRRDRITRFRTRTGKSRDGRTYTVITWYTARGQKVLEYWLVEGLGHAWSGGTPGGSFSDPAGPRASTAIWQFLSSKTHM